MNTQRVTTWGACLLGLGSVVVSLAACDVGDGAEQDALAEAEELVPQLVLADAAVEADDAGAGAGVIGEVVVGTGSVRFLDQSLPDGTPSVGMLAVGLPGLLADVRALGLTPLELHLALADGEAPDLLWEHHLTVAEERGLAAAPRQVEVEGHGPKLVGELTNGARPVLSIGTYAMANCTTSVQVGAPTWADIYCVNIAGGYDACGSGVTHGTRTIVTGAAEQNFLGACTPSTGLTFRVERNISGSLWQLVTSVTIAADHGVDYENDDQSLFLSYRAIMTPVSSTADYQWGAARDNN